MSNIFKKILVVITLSLVVFTTVKALQIEEIYNGNDYDFINYEFIEDTKLASSRYTRPDDTSLVDPDLIIEIDDRDDVLISENSNFQLYFNEENISFKILDKETNYVWSTSIDRVRAGTYDGLLSSGIGIEYILIEKDLYIEENVGLSEIAFELEQEPIQDGVKLSLNLGGYCSGPCKRLYDDYLEGRVTMEVLIEKGYTDINIAFDLEVRLTDTGIEAFIPLDSIVEEYPEKMILSSIILFPGLGATKMDEIPGYMVIPDGAGALIRYEDNEEQFNAPFEERFFSENIGLQDFRQSVINYPLSMPIFGAVHGVNQNAFIGIIEGGQYSSRLLSYPNGAHNLDYNLIFPKFDILQVYRQSFSSDGSGGAMKYIQTSFQDIEVKYNFLNGEAANYVGIGENYRDYLDALGDLEKQTQTGDIEIFLNYLMSDTESSFFGNKLIEMSTVDQVLEMYSYFMDLGLTNQSVALMGWNNGGYSGELPSAIDFENNLGSNKDFRNMIDFINQENSVMLQNNYLFATGSTDGISYRNEVAKGTNKFKLELIFQNRVHNQIYVLYPYVSSKLALNDFDDYINEDVNVLFEALGTYLYSYYNGDYYNREDTYLDFLEIMQQYEEIGNYMYPYSYAYKYANGFYEAPLYNSQLKYYDDVIPLIQIVLKGSIDMYASYLNYNSLGRETILNLIDFGMNPAYVLTYQPSSMLKDTDLERYFTTEFGLWKDTVVTEYEYINNALKYVNGEYISSRIVLDYGIVKVSYSNGVDIYINYTSHIFSEGGITIPAMDYFVGGVS
ncbi:DUF5696 domain-containing protein [Mycoplasmatota bacterium WC30]